ncbi:MAG: GntR family transcriptional regulator [Leucobacter sp.]
MTDHSNNRQDSPPVEAAGQSHTSAYAQLLERITNGELPPGARLREAALADELGVSRTPVREALRSLAAEGLVDIIRNRGAQVRSWTVEQLEDTYALRSLLEGYAARRAVERSDEVGLARLRELQDELENAVERRPAGWLDTVADANSRFHAVIIELAATPFLSGIIATLHSASFVRRAFRGYSSQDLQRTIVAHRDIIRGIEQRNSELSAAAMQAHILAAVPAAVHVLSNS